tara:strand:- start:106 stop:654 length:549 start_codon:yes stop_codon:yes gene_type:complete
MSGYSETKYSASGVKTGTIVPHGSTTVPTGFLYCDGSAVSRTTYANLFSVISTTYGAGNGSSTFNLPDLQNNVPLGRSGTKALGSTGGAESRTPSGSVSVANHTLTISQIPSHNHLEGSHTEFGSTSSQSAGTRNTGNDSPGRRFFTSNTGGGGAHNHGGSFSGSSMSVLQPYLALNYIIKT